MNILILNGSPKGKNSVTLHTALYLEKVHAEHTFEVLHVGQKIRQYEKDFSQAKLALEKAELILFVYPVYTFLAPYQMHRFIELMKADGVQVSGKFASQITTSMHFYDVTAHKFIEENCHDMGMKYIPGLSADMEDLLCEKGRKEAEGYFAQLLFFMENDIFSKPRNIFPKQSSPYQKSISNVAKNGKYTVAMVVCRGDGDVNLDNMIDDFCAASTSLVKKTDVRAFPFAGGCLGCLQCATGGRCVYKDGFEDYLRDEIQRCDAIVYAFTIQNHYAHASFKNFDDRQFCNGHRTVTEGMPVGYIISGDYGNESNLRTVIEARSEVGGNFLAGVATDEENTAEEIRKLAKSMDKAIAAQWSRPKNFYGVGGGKIFRDLVYMMRGIMKADHRFYKKHGVYDFPQKQKKKTVMMQLAGAMLAIPSVQKKMRGKLGEFMIEPYRKAVQSAQKEHT